MSNTMAFVAGAGLAGIAALLLFRGGTPSLPNLSGVTSLQPSSTNLQNPNAPQQLPGWTAPGTIPPGLNPTGIAPPGTTPPGLATGLTPGLPPGGDPNSPYFATMKAQLDQLRTENEQLKMQQRNQQFVIDALTAQGKLPGWNGQGNPPQLTSAATASQVNGISMTSVMWALGGMAVTVASGLVLAGTFALISRQQRPGRTLQLVQPITQLPPSLPQRRRPEVTGTRYDDRRDYIDYDEYDDYEEYDGR